MKTKTSVEELRSDASLQAQAKSLQADQQKFQVEQAYTERELKITEAKAIGQINQRLKTIINEIAKERNA